MLDQRLDNTSPNDGRSNEDLHIVVIAGHHAYEADDADHVGLTKPSTLINALQ